MKTSFEFRSKPLWKQVLIMLVSLTVLIGVLGIVIDLGQLYLRRSDLQDIAQAAAAAAAKRLNGQPSGLNAAVMTATLTTAATAADLGQPPLLISDEQVRFAPAPEGPWLPLTTAAEHPDEQRFVRVEVRSPARQHHPAWPFPQLDPSPISSAASATGVAGVETGVVR